MPRRGELFAECCVPRMLHVPAPLPKHISAEIQILGHPAAIATGLLELGAGRQMPGCNCAAVDGGYFVVLPIYPE